MTNFEDFHSRAWADHATDAAGVASRLYHGLVLLTKPEQVPLMARLVAHVYGEHLGRWKDGISLLVVLRDRTTLLLDEAGDQAIDRFERALRFCDGDRAAIDRLNASGQARTLTVIAPALVGQGRFDDGARLFGEASAQVARLGKTDPAHREFAAAANNLALSLEEKAKRTAAETELMLLAARLARREWEIAGGPLQVMRAEYRLAISHVQAGLAEEAVRHAETGLELAAAHAAGDCDLFFLYEALALAQRASGKLESFAKAVERAKEYFSRLTGDDKKWCEPVMGKLERLV